MNEKPEALRLADDLHRDAKRELFRYLDLDKAAAELLRQHAEIERLRDELRQSSIDIPRAEIERLRVERLREALREIADETYDSWTNGAKAQRIAESALKEDKR